MLNSNDRVERARSIRGHLLNYMDSARSRTAAGARRELLAARKELNILVRLEGWEEGDDDAGTGATAKAETKG